MFPQKLASRAGPAPHPSRRDTRRTTRLLNFQKDGGSGSPRTGAGGSLLAKRLFARTSRLLPFLSTSGVRRSCTDEGFEALTGFALGGEIAGAADGFGTMLCSEQTLQCEGLLDGEAGEFVAGLCGIERAGGVA